jgi:hypothetical protein
LLDMQLGAVKGDAGYCGTIGSVYSLMIDGLIICVAVELGVKGEVVIIGFVVLVTLHVREDDAAGGLVNRSNDHVDYVPVCLESAVGETCCEGSSGVDTFKEGVVVAADLYFPCGAALAELEEVVEETNDR